MKYCIYCQKPAKFVIQWGPKPDQKEYTCEEHLSDLVNKVPAIELFVVKIGKIK